MIVKVTTRRVLRRILPAATLLGLWAVAANAAERDANLVTNPSFEQPGTSSLPEGWHANPRVYARDTEVHRTGQAALRYVNADPRRYELCNQKIPVHPGWKCRFGAWIKTEDLRGAESGATICLEWLNAQGKWLGGNYPAGIKGTHDWTHMEGMVRVPEKAASVTLTCYARQGMTGTAWFDDAEVVRIADPAMQVILRSPVYRHWITAQRPDQAQLRVHLNLADYDLRPQDVRALVRLRDAAGQTRWESTLRSGSDTDRVLDMTVPLQGITPGRYEVELRLVGPDGKELETAHEPLVRMPDDFRPRCIIARRPDASIVRQAELLRQARVDRDGHGVALLPLLNVL